MLDACPILRNAYTPPLFWGQSGVIQTLLFTFKGRFGTPSPKGETLALPLMPDGSVSIVDVYEPSAQPTGRRCAASGTASSGPAGAITRSHPHPLRSVRFGQ